MTGTYQLRSGTRSIVRGPLALVVGQALQVATYERPVFIHHDDVFVVVKVVDGRTTAHWDRPLELFPLVRRTVSPPWLDRARRILNDLQDNP